MMFLTKGEMKGLANGLVSKEALTTISAAKIDQFEGWCESRPFKHFLNNRACINSPCKYTALRLLKEWAADELYYLIKSEREEEDDATEAPQTVASKTVASQTPTAETAVGTATTSSAPVIEAGPVFHGDDMIAF